MIKDVYILAPAPSVGEAEAMRFYLRYHSREVVRFVGPWLRRYENYRALNAPLEADRFNVSRGSLTELWYESVEAWKEAAPQSKPYTAPTFGWENVIFGAIVQVQARPTEDFLGKEPTSEERPIIRWVCALKYPEGVSVEEGEKWYLETHSQEVKQQPGLLRYVSHKVTDNPLFPSSWHRVSELWYENFNSWKADNIDSPPKYTPPPWGRKEQPFLDMASTFVGYQPYVDFLRDHPIIP